jgi:alcohol dehydrogenase (cytochrome c)
VPQTWNSGLRRERPADSDDRSESSPEGNVIAPTIGGATNFQAPSYSPTTGWVYLAFSAGSQRYISDTPKFESGRQYPGGRGAPSGQTRSAGIKAIDPETGKTMWEFPLAQGR